MIFWHGRSVRMITVGGYGKKRIFQKSNFAARDSGIVLRIVISIGAGKILIFQVFTAFSDDIY